MLRYLPLIVSAVAIGAVAVYNGINTNRWDEDLNAKARKYAQRFESLPFEIGRWVGVDEEKVDDNVLRVAGAAGYVSRIYRNLDTNEEVRVWLIVGHSSEIVRHTPDVCYPADNFKPESKKSYHYKFPVDGEETVQCWTNLFSKKLPGQEVIYRVYWMWHDTRQIGKVKWDAPGHTVRDARFEFGGSRALFKLYFTTAAENVKEQPDQSVAVGFAQEFLPVLNEVISRPDSATPETAEEAESESEEAPAAEAAA